MQSPYQPAAFDVQERNFEDSFGHEVRQIMLKDAESALRMGFVRKVYGILSAQLLLTTLIALPFQFMESDQLAKFVPLLFVCIALQITLMCVMICCKDVLRKYPQNYAILGAFTVVMGVVVGIVSATYTAQSVAIAVGITVFVFLGMTVYAWNTKTDFTGAGPYLMGALMVMMAFGLVLSVLSFGFGVNMSAMHMVYDFLGVLLFTMYIVYDTQLMFGGNHKVSLMVDDYCFGALNLYLDVINLFLHLLSLLGERK